MRLDCNSQLGGGRDAELRLHLPLGHLEATLVSCCGGGARKQDATLSIYYPPLPLNPCFVLQDDKNSSLLNNYVLGAQLDQRRVKNLRDLVNISFWHNQSLVLLGAPTFPSYRCPLWGCPVECWFGSKIRVNVQIGLTQS